MHLLHVSQSATLRGSHLAAGEGATNAGYDSSVQYFSAHTMSEIVSATTALGRLPRGVNLRMKILSVNHLDLMLGTYF